MFRHLVEEFVSDLEVLGQAENVAEAQQLVDTIKPDLLVVDHASYQGGFQTIESWRSEMPMNIALMAHYHEMPSIPASNAVAEIISKPVDVEGIRHLARTIGSMQLQVQASGSDAFLVPDLAQIGNQNSKIALPMPKGFKIVQLNDILFCSADRVYTDFTLRNGVQLTASRSLKYFEELLGSFGFQRIHASFLVNLDHVQEYVRGSSGKGGVLLLTEEHQIPVARGRKSELLVKFSIKAKES